MKIKEKRKASAATDAARIASEIRLRLTRMGVDLPQQPALDSLPVDLADIYEVCANYLNLIDKFLALPSESQKARLLTLLTEIYNNLYVHLPYHYKRLPEGLKALERVIEPDESKREAFADETLQETLSTINKFLKEL